MPPPRIAIIADDLTGAADTAGGMLGLGQPWVTWADDIQDLAWPDDERIVAVDAATRHLTAAAAADSVRTLAARFRTSGFAQLYKKVDSTLRGHPGAEVRAALDGWHPQSVAVVAPAFPALGRATIDGRQHVGDVPLDSPPLAALLAAAGVPVTAVPLVQVRSTGLAGLLQSTAETSPGSAIVCDAVTEADLAAIAAAGATLAGGVVWVGSGGLARTIRLADPLARDGSRGTVPATLGSVLIVCGSLSPVSREQAQRVAAGGITHVVVTTAALSSGGALPRAASGGIERHLRAGADVLVTIDAAHPAPARVDPAIVERLASMLAPFRSLVGGLVATGGDTASALLRRWNIGGLRLLSEAEAGVPIGIAPGARPLVVALKAGAFGGQDTLATSHAAVRSLLRCSQKP